MRKYKLGIYSPEGRVGKLQLDDSISDNRFLSAENEK
jgi:hypothetical protein